MRKLLISQMVSLDGLFSGPNGELDWHMVDEDFNEFAIDQLNQVDTLIFGRVTYGWMAGYWPTPVATTDDPVVAGKMNELSKIVFSKTLDKTEWNNSRIVKGDLAQEIAKLKGQPGKDMVVFGSGQITSALAQLGLIDEYRIFVCPLVLGNGVPLFKGVTKRLDLKLLRSKAFRSGVIMSCYAPQTA